MPNIKALRISAKLKQNKELYLFLFTFYLAKCSHFAETHANLFAICNLRFNFQMYNLIACKYVKQSNTKRELQFNFACKNS